MSNKFIPKKFIDKRMKETKTRLDIMIKITLIINLILLPSTISNIKVLINNKEIKSKINENIVADIGVNIDELKDWMNILYKTSRSGEIKNNEGSMLIMDKKYIDYISKEKTIESIENKGEEGYYLKVLGK